MSASPDVVAPAASIANHDIAIIGAGPVGTALALSLCQQCEAPRFSIALIEKAAPLTTINIGARTTALNRESLDLLERAGVDTQDWQRITNILVSEGKYASLLSAHREGIAYFGKAVNADRLQQRLQQALNPHTAQPTNAPDTSRPQPLTLHYQTTVEQIREHAEHIALRLNNGQTLNAKTVIAADGATSSVRNHLGITAETRDYRQTALLCKAEVTPDYQSMALERFAGNSAGDSILALLPVEGSLASFIWVADTIQAARLTELADSAFLHAANAALGAEVIANLVTPRKTYALTETYLPRAAHGRIAFIGNARHSLHPLAAQGLNLSLYEVAALTRAVEQHGTTAAALTAYEADTVLKVERVRWFVHGLLGVFLHPARPIKSIRRRLISAVDYAGPIRRTALHRLTGLASLS